MKGEPRRFPVPNERTWNVIGVADAEDLNLSVAVVFSSDPDPRYSFRMGMRDPRANVPGMWTPLFVSEGEGGVMTFPHETRLGEAMVALLDEAHRIAKEHAEGLKGTTWKPKSRRRRGRSSKST